MHGRGAKTPGIWNLNFFLKNRLFSTWEFCTPVLTSNILKSATWLTKVCQGFLGAEIDFSQNSKRFGKMKAFYTLEKLDFFWKCFLVFLWDNFDEIWVFFQKSVGGEQNCLTKGPKIIFRKNQNFPTCRMLSFSQIFWNYGKSRSQLRESLDKLFGWWPLKSYVASGFRNILWHFGVQSRNVVWELVRVPKLSENIFVE